MNFKPTIIFIVLLFLFTSCKQTNEQLLDKAYSFSKQKKYDEAIKVYTEVIKQNNKLQLAYYNRGFAYLGTKNFKNAYADFNKVMTLQTLKNYAITFNKDIPHADEQTRTQVPYYDALYQRAQVKYLMDSLKSSFIDFQTLIDNNYEEKSNCTLWQGTIYIKNNESEKACEYFDKAKQFALSDIDRNQAGEMIKAYCR
jgi:tetratricopeptide (TPR) repeat protein